VLGCEGPLTTIVAVVNSGWYANVDPRTFSIVVKLNKQLDAAWAPMKLPPESRYRWNALCPDASSTSSVVERKKRASN
jgi:hypothetical protein